MIDFEGYLYDRVKPILATWRDPDIYAVSFFVYSNEAYEYRDVDNISCFHISHNTEKNCDGAGETSEVRWNYAFWPQDVDSIIDPDIEGDPGTEMLMRWYREQGIEDVGREDGEDYDDDMNYIGRGPVGYFELLTAVSNVARRIQEEGLLREVVGKPVPILVHELEYPWYVEDATKRANPSGEARDFLRWLKESEDMADSEDED